MRWLHSPPYHLQFVTRLRRILFCCCFQRNDFSSFHHCCLTFYDPQRAKAQSNNSETWMTAEKYSPFGECSDRMAARTTGWNPIFSEWLCLCPGNDTGCSDRINAIEAIERWRHSSAAMLTSCLPGWTNRCWNEPSKFSCAWREFLYAKLAWELSMTIVGCLLYTWIQLNRKLFECINEEFDPSRIGSCS